MKYSVQGKTHQEDVWFQNLVGRCRCCDPLSFPFWIKISIAIALLELMILNEQAESPQ
jgi:hypothetical protein